MCVRCGAGCSFILSGADLVRGDKVRVIQHCTHSWKGVSASLPQGCGVTAALLRLTSTLMSSVVFPILEQYHHIVPIYRNL